MKTAFNGNNFGRLHDFDEVFDEVFVDDGCCCGIRCHVIVPFAKQPPEKIHRVVEDSDAVLKCRTFGAPKPIVKWTRAALSLTGSRYQIQDNGDLKIISVKYSDQVSRVTFVDPKRPPITQRVISISYVVLSFIGKVHVLRDEQIRRGFW